MSHDIMPTAIVDGIVIATGEDAVRLAAETLTVGRVIALATDTVYGLAAALDRPDAIAAIFRIKGRPDTKPLPILLADIESVSTVADVQASTRLLGLAAQFWPGPLTIALPARADVPTATLHPNGTVGVRVPDHAISRSVLRASGGAAAVTSANVSTFDPATTAIALRDTLGDHPDLALILDTGPSPGGIVSTVIGAENDKLVIYRQGAIPAELVCQAWAELPAHSGVLGRA